ncbi:MAG: hypothetical protein MJE12_03025, partial [Alphaproteobacteria bacterium]|nr:hypothetical protein [Alphaproteobacteria bacterium]
RVCVVAGYQGQAVCDAAGGDADVIYNDQWSSTNSLYSLWLCRRWIQGPVIILNCDVLFHAEAIRRLTATPGNAFLYDSQSGDDPEHMKVAFEDGRLSAMSKSMSAHRVRGENVGVLQFDAQTVPFLVEEAAAALAKAGRDHWLAAAVERVCQFVPMRGVDICDLPWIEIDFPEDLDTARRVTWPDIQKIGHLPGLHGFVDRSGARSAVAAP